MEAVRRRVRSHSDQRNAGRLAAASFALRKGDCLGCFENAQPFAGVHVWVSTCRDSGEDERAAQYVKQHVCRRRPVPSRQKGAAGVRMPGGYAAVLSAAHCSRGDLFTIGHRTWTGLTAATNVVS